MEFIESILFMIAAITICCVLYYLVLRYQHARNVDTFENYDRELTQRDEVFLTQADAELEAKANEKTPRWYSIFLITAFLPTMFLSWGVICGSLWSLQRLINLTRSVPENSIYHTGGELAWAYVPGVFGGIFLAGFALYAVSLKKREVSNYVALHSNMHGFDVKSVRQGLLLKLEHNIRIGAQKSDLKFSADALLKDVNETYRDICLKWFYGSMIVVLCVGFFDLRSKTVLFPDRIESTGKYFSISKNKSMEYEDISGIELDCYFSDDRPTAHFVFISDDQTLASLKLEKDSLKPLTRVNTILRDQDKTMFKPRMNKTGQSQLFSRCIKRLGVTLGEPDLVRAILKVDP